MPRTKARWGEEGEEGKVGRKRMRREGWTRKGNIFLPIFGRLLGKGKKGLFFSVFFHACELLCMCVLFCRSAASDIYPGLEREV